MRMNTRGICSWLAVLIAALPTGQQEINLPAKAYFAVFSRSKDGCKLLEQSREVSPDLLREEVQNFVASNAFESRNSVGDAFRNYLDDSTDLSDDAKLLLKLNFSIGAASVRGMERILSSDDFRSVLKLDASEKKTLENGVKSLRDKLRSELIKIQTEYDKDLRSILTADQLLICQRFFDERKREEFTEFPTLLVKMDWLSKCRQIGNELLDSQAEATLALTRMLGEERIGVVDEFGSLKFHENPFQNAYSVINFIAVVPSSTITVEKKQTIFEAANKINDKFVGQVKNVGRVVELTGRKELFRRKGMQDAFKATLTRTKQDLDKLLTDTLDGETLDTLDELAVEQFAEKRGIAYVILRCRSVRLSGEQLRDVVRCIEKTIEKLENAAHLCSDGFSRLGRSLDSSSSVLFSKFSRGLTDRTILLMVVDR